VGIDYRLHGRLKGDQTSDWIQVGLMAGTNLRFDPVLGEACGQPQRHSSFYILSHEVALALLHSLLHRFLPRRGRMRQLNHRLAREQLRLLARPGGF
jgi:hypothetical protein